MSDPNNYESEDGATHKYYQVLVPSFAERSATNVPTMFTDGTSIPAYSGTSFLRIGAAFDPLTDWKATSFAASVALASLVGDPTKIAAAEGITVTNGKVDGTKRESSNASTSTSSDSDSFTDSYGDGSGAVGPYGAKGDSNYLLGFADDTRYRGTPGDAAGLAPKTLVNGQAVDNTNANRQAETLRLLTKGGWWDHADGNRVSTTAGDKIEVIQGNYKMVVLGRQAKENDPGKLAANAFITDVSGGHFQEQYPSPTPCIKTVEYCQDESGEWTLYQDNGKGNLVTKLHGRTVDLFQGSKRETYVGSEPSGDDDSPNSTFDPEIVSKTWAQKIETYTGSVKKRVPLVYSLTYADAIEDIRFAAYNVTSSTSASTIGNITLAASVTNLTTVGVMMSLNLVALAVEVNAGAKFVFGWTRTSVRGKNTSIDAGKTMASITEESLVATRTAMSDNFNQLSISFQALAMSSALIADDSIVAANLSVNMSQTVFLG